MRRILILSGAGLALLLAGCDQIRLPGASPVTAEEKPAATAALPDDGRLSEADLQPPGTDLAALEPAAMVTPAPAQEEAPDLTDPAETETADTGAAEPEDATDTALSEAGPAPAEGEDADTADVQPAALAAMNLGQINAMRCALPEGVPATPTVAMAAGATEIEEPLAGIEAVGGLAATLTAFPGIVKLEPRRAEASGAVASGHCGALRIAANWFVTAAHCVDQPFDEIRLIGEAEDLRSPAARRASAAGAVCHAGYQGTANGYANDIALVRLGDDQLEAFANVPVARFGRTGLPLAPANFPRGDMAGWGITRYGGQLSSQLLSTGLEIVSAGPAAITVRSVNGAGPCIGDSGGPLFVTEADGSRTAIGILSVVEQNRITGNFCEGEYVGRYTSLEGYSGWITSVMSLCETDPGACQ